MQIPKPKSEIPNPKPTNTKPISGYNATRNRDRPNAEHVRFCRTEHGRTEHVRFGFETQMFGRTLEDNNSETACRIGFKFWVLMDLYWLHWHAKLQGVRTNRFIVITV